MILKIEKYSTENTIVDHVINDREENGQKNDTHV